jgi:hypothetical protein
VEVYWDAKYNPKSWASWWVTIRVKI